MFALQHAARALQAGGLRRRLGGAPAAARGRSSSRSSSAASPGCRSDGMPYPVFNYSAMILWLYVSLRRRRGGAEPRREPRPRHEGVLPAARRAALRGVPRARRPRDRVRRARRDARRLRRDAELGGRADTRSGSSPRCSVVARGRLPALGAERALPRRAARASARRSSCGSSRARSSTRARSSRAAGSTSTP